MRLFILLGLFSTFVLISCTTEKTTNTADSGTTATANKVSNQATNPLATNKQPETAMTNSGETLAPVVRGYYEALGKNDETGVKKYLSSAAIKYYEEEARDEKKSWLKFLSESEDPISEKREIRNEKITGETATAELKGGSLGVWTKINFVKEGGEWKFASPADSEELKGVSK